MEKCGAVVLVKINENKILNFIFIVLCFYAFNVFPDKTVGLK